MVLRLIHICREFNVVWFTFSILDWKRLFFCKFAPKNENCQFKLKFGTLTISNILSSMVMFAFFSLESLFLRKFGPSNQNCQFKLKFGTLTISNILSSMEMFAFFFTRITLFEEIWSKQSIVSLSWNLVLLKSVQN